MWATPGCATRVCGGLGLSEAPLGAWCADHVHVAAPDAVRPNVKGTDLVQGD